MHKLFGILLHRFVSSSYLLIFSVIFISLQTHGYLFYNFGLLSIQLYYFCSHCSSFGHQEFFQLILTFLLRPLIWVCGRECVCRVLGSGGGLFILITFLSGTSGNFQAHLGYFLPQSQSQPFFSGAMASFLGEWCLECKFLELVVIAIGPSLLLGLSVGRAICIIDISVSACTHIKIHRCLISLIAIKSMQLLFYLLPFSFEAPFSDTENSSPCIFYYMHNPRI